MIHKEKFRVIKIKAQWMAVIHHGTALHFAAWLPTGRVK